jgi:hypothetical protein
VLLVITVNLNFSNEFKWAGNLLGRADVEIGPAQDGFPGGGRGK